MDLANASPVALVVSKKAQNPCLYRWSEKGSITTQICVAILSALDTLQIFNANRDNGIKPLLIVDSHISRFELPFLQYICDKEYEWAIFIGVPYGTTLWKVGGTTE